MSKKQLSGVLASVLLLGLTACNNQDAALNPRNNDNITNVVNRDNNRNHLFNVNNNPNLDVDHRGPLTKNNTNDLKTIPMTGIRIQIRMVLPLSLILVRQCRVMNIHIQNRYQIQDARYQFLPVDPRQDTSFQTQLRQRYQGIVPGLEQQPEQQPLAQAPAQHNNLIKLQHNNSNNQSSSSKIAKTNSSSYQ